jgi:hypothetical protein
MYIIPVLKVDGRACSLQNVAVPLLVLELLSGEDRDGVERWKGDGRGCGWLASCGGCCRTASLNGSVGRLPLKKDEY